MARVCSIRGSKVRVGRKIHRSGLAKKKGGIGRHVTKVNKRLFIPNLQRVKIITENGTVKYVRVAASAIKKGLITKAPKRNWKKPEKKA